jgi:predicted alpha/beta-hydrolase family hydrolase
MTIVLAHGAGAGRDHPWMHRVARAFDQTGIRIVTFNFPYMDAGRKAPDKGPVLEAHFAAVWKNAVAGTEGPYYAGGKSMGGRIASQVAARQGFDPPPAGLIFFGYPLHPPNQPAKRRDAHLPHVTAPMLFLHGTRDPFGTPDELLAASATIAGPVTHVWIDGGGHGLRGADAEVSSAVATFVRRLR